MTKWPRGIKEILSKGIDGITRKDVLELRKKLMELNHYIVRKAIKKGEIYKEDKCFCCGVVGAATYPHHKNYFKPLDIAWVCSSCHVITHNRVTEECIDMLVEMYGVERADRIKALMLPINQRLSEVRQYRKLPQSYITGSRRGDEQLWNARINNCGKSCKQILALTRKDEPKLGTLEWVENIGRYTLPPVTYKRVKATFTLNRND